jgi:alpha-glucuronidase
MGEKAQLFLTAVIFTLFLAIALTTQAQTADQAWLRYSAGNSQTESTFRVHALGSGSLEQSAASELQRGLKGLPSAAYLGVGNVTTQIDLGTEQEVHDAYPTLDVPHHLGPEGYWVNRAYFQNQVHFIVAGSDDRGVLYGAFALLRQILTAQDLTHLDLRSDPAFPIRWVDEWDNPDGSIERGYAGRSIFFEGGNVRDDLAPVSEYGRLLASVGINGLNVNNVNAAPQLIDSDHLKQLARIADALRPWGVHLAMSVAIASPQTIGGLKTYDPLDPAVKAWWAAKANEVYGLIPDFAGFTVKADSEGQPGPASFGRTPADAANTLAAALAPHGGVVLYRAFVYNHHLDWRDPKADRARAAYDIFHPLDGKFAPNVIVQTKEGPIDFQVREPVSPLFAGLEHTAQAMEVQITQEYTGQQRHLVYLAPMWKWVLDTDLRAHNKPSRVKEILAGKTFHQPLGGMVGVAGIGRDRWLSSPLALANLYAFGRLAWDPSLDPSEIAGEWIRQTISTDPAVVATAQNILMQSWQAYESYTGALGLQTLTDITGSHYGPNIESSERNGWGQWHDADAHGVGKDRTVATGSGYAGQYSPALAKLYEDPATTPDDLLLFFHHVPYTYRLHNGKTVIQYLYDSHYEGAAQAAEFVKDWQSLQPKIDPSLYADVLARLEYQAGHAIVWRDAVVQYFHKLSGIPDAQGRAGNFPGRLEAEDARLTGYQIIDVHPWEDASLGKAVLCQGTTSVVPNASQTDSVALAPEAAHTCTAQWTWTGAAGAYGIVVQYFDLPGGAAKFTLLVNGQPVSNWTADASVPSTRPNGDNSTRKTVNSIDLKTGDTIEVKGEPDGSDPAALDYIELTPVSASVPAPQRP